MGPLAMLALQTAPAVINAVSTGINNRQQKKFAQQQYATQRADNLADWERQNQYNSPIAQMTRLQEAGLNPNLIYKGGATNQAGEVSKAQFGSYNPQAPRFEMDLVDSLNKYQNYQNQKLQADNLKQNLQIAKAQEKLIESNVLKNLKTTDKLSFDIFRGNTLLGYQADMAKEGVRNINARTEFTLDENKRKWIMSAPKLEETLSRISQIKAQTSKVPFEKQLLEQNIGLMKSKNYWYSISEGQKQVMNNILQESNLIKNGLMRKQGSQYDATTDLIKLRTDFMKAGVSPQVTENMIKSILSIIDFF